MCFVVFLQNSAYTAQAPIILAVCELDVWLAVSTATKAKPIILKTNADLCEDAHSGVVVILSKLKVKYY